MCGLLSAPSFLLHFPPFQPCRAPGLGLILGAVTGGTDVHCTTEASWFVSHINSLLFRSCILWIFISFPSLMSHSKGHHLQVVGLAVLLVGLDGPRGLFQLFSDSTNAAAFAQAAAQGPVQTPTVSWS